MPIIIIVPGASQRVLHQPPLCLAEAAAPQLRQTRGCCGLCYLPRTHTQRGSHPLKRAPPPAEHTLRHNPRGRVWPWSPVHLGIAAQHQRETPLANATQASGSARLEGDISQRPCAWSTRLSIKARPELGQGRLTPSHQIIASWGAAANRRRYAHRAA